MPWPACCTWIIRAKAGGGFESPWWKRKPGGHCFPERVQQNGLRQLPDAITIAEESTARGRESQNPPTGGLGFGQKWMMGWMHDTLQYSKRDPIHLGYHQNDITFSLVYLRRILCCRSRTMKLIYTARARCSAACQAMNGVCLPTLHFIWIDVPHPGTKLLFMGGEVGAIPWMESRQQLALAFCSTVIWIKA